MVCTHFSVTYGNMSHPLVPQKQPWSQQFTADSETDSEKPRPQSANQRGLSTPVEGSLAGMPRMAREMACNKTVSGGLSRYCAKSRKRSSRMAAATCWAPLFFLVARRVQYMIIELAEVGELIPHREDWPLVDQGAWRGSGLGSLQRDVALRPEHDVVDRQVRVLCRVCSEVGGASTAR